jgi:hypothetical protein
MSGVRSLNEALKQTLRLEAAKVAATPPPKLQEVMAVTPTRT